MEPAWSRAQGLAQRSAWDQVLKPVGAELAANARKMSVEVVKTISERLPDLLPDDESFEANRASTEASILGFAQILEQGGGPGYNEPGGSDPHLHPGGGPAGHPPDNIDPQL